MDQQAAYQMHAIKALTLATRSNTEGPCAAQIGLDELNMSRISHGGSMKITWPRDDWMIAI